MSAPAEYNIQDYVLLPKQTPTLIIISLKAQLSDRIYQSIRIHQVKILLL